MKKLIFFLFCLISFFGNSQTKNSNDSSISYITQRAEFPGGDEAFRKELFKYINGYIDLKHYAVNGLFVFSFDIDTEGKTKNLSVTPRVKNSELFIDDMLFCMRKVKTKWKPAIENGVPVKSRYSLKINFITDHTEHE